MIVHGVIVHMSVANIFLGLCASGEAYPMPQGCHRRMSQKDVGWRDPKEEFHFSLMLRLSEIAIVIAIYSLRESCK